MMTLNNELANEEDNGNGEGEDNVNGGDDNVNAADDDNGLSPGMPRMGYLG